MTRSLEGRVALVTGAGSGIGRAHALRLAAEGARVAVNDWDPAAADAVCDTIRASGGTAVAAPGDVADWATAERLIGMSIDAFGSLDVLVNNAGIIREQIIAKMSEQDWDDVIRVHLKGHFAMLRWASAYWRERSKAGDAVDASVINTTSNSGLLGQPAQAGYGAAKAAIAGLTTIAAVELAPYGVRVNAIAPAARTAMTDKVAAVREFMAPPASGLDRWDPDHAASVIAFLARPGLDITGQCWLVLGGRIRRFAPWSLAEEALSDEPWTPDNVADVLPGLSGTRWTEPFLALEP